MYFDQSVETLPKAQLRELQSERFRKLVQYVYQQVPFYRDQWNEAGIHPDQINGIDDLHRLPFTMKTDLRDNYPFKMFAVPNDQLARIHCSSGTTGKPTVVGYTKNDLALFAEVNARSLYAAGARPGMMLHNAYGYGLFTGGLGLHAGAERLGMNVIPVSGGMTDRQLMILQDFGPEVISCTPSYAQRLTEEIRKRGISLDSLNLKYAVLGAEPWTEVIRQDIEKGLNIKASNIYGLSEIVGPGVSQEAVEERGTGSHVWEDHFFPEIVDAETGEVLPEGKDGVLVFTTLTKEAFPVIRYWTNDICSLYYDSDSRRTHIKMGTIKGRADDMLIIRGVNFFHTQVEAVLEDIPRLAPHYQVIVSREGTMDQVEIKIELDADFQSKVFPGLSTEDQLPDHDKVRELTNLLGKKIKDNIGISVKVEIKPGNSIPRSEGGKLSRVVDLRK
jgi:phenylacetate-CoA ligase